MNSFLMLLANTQHSLTNTDKQRERERDQIEDTQKIIRAAKAMEFKNAAEEANRVDMVDESLESNEIEQSKVGIMRAIVQTQDPSSKVLSPSIPLFHRGPLILMYIA